MSVFPRKNVELYIFFHKPEGLPYDKRLDLLFMLRGLSLAIRHVSFGIKYPNNKWKFVGLCDDGLECMSKEQMSESFYRAYKVGEGKKYLNEVIDRVNKVHEQKKKITPLSLILAGFRIPSTTCIRETIEMLGLPCKSNLFPEELIGWLDRCNYTLLTEEQFNE